MSASPKIIERWRAGELTLRSARRYDNPYRDVDVWVRFKGPRGEEIDLPAFWDGGDVWKARFAPTSTGRWWWFSECNFTEDEGLHGEAGSIECVPYKGDLEIYRRGFLRISDDRRYFVYDDSTPFFWLGDTHWQMPDTERLDACNHPEHVGGACPFGGQFQHLVADRKRKGFTVYQTYPAVSNRHWWKEAYTLVEPAHFHAVFDPQIRHLADEGFVIALGCGHFNSSTTIAVEELRRWARYLVARYAAYPVVWITCQEMNAPEDRMANRIDVWKAVAEEIHRVDGYRHPHSAHQWVVDVDVRPLGQEPWHDWFALQGGHRGSGLTPKRRYAGYYGFQPTKPVIETEAMYELVDCGGVADTNDARKSAWKAFLCGCAGYTYGAAGVWALKWNQEDPRWTNYNHPIEAWYAGMALPGSEQMSVLKTFFVNLPSWWRLVPRFDDPEWAEWEDAERSVLATDGNDVYVAYFYGATSKGVLKNLDPASPYRAEWFDPRTGRTQAVASSFVPVSGSWEVPPKPAETDWVLVVRRAGS